MKNDCSLLPANPSSSLLIREAFAKSFTKQLSFITTVVAANETINNGVETNSNISSTPALTVVTGVNNNAITFCGDVMNNHDDVMPINSRSNTVRCSCNEDQLSLQYASMLVTIRFNVRVMRFSVVVIRINVGSNTISHRCNTHQWSYQYGSMLVYWSTLFMYSPSIPVFSISSWEKYDTALMQRASISLAA